MSDDEIKISPAEWSKIAKEIELDRLRRERAEKKAREPQVVGKCLVCRASVKEDIDYMANRLGGPAEKHVSGYYCTGCGLAYARKPKRRK